MKVATFNTFLGLNWKADEVRILDAQLADDGFTAKGLNGFVVMAILDDIFKNNGQKLVIIHLDEIILFKMKLGIVAVQGNDTCCRFNLAKKHIIIIDESINHQVHII